MRHEDASRAPCRPATYAHQAVTDSLRERHSDRRAASAGLGESRTDEHRRETRVVTMDKIAALCKRRGFVFPGSDIYGGLANTWDYGPLGAS